MLNKALHWIGAIAFLFSTIPSCEVIAKPFQKRMNENATSSPCIEFNKLNNLIRDKQITRKEALSQLQSLFPRVKKYFFEHGGKANQNATIIFPLESYNYKAVGGNNGSGYISWGYDYFDGNKHGGHPAHDIFIADKNQDCIDDKTGKPVNVLSVSSGIVVACESNWEEHSEQRGGNYIWIYDPGHERLYYYAHNNKIFVSPGTLVKPGDKIALVGRTGLNAIKKRSPTHLHFMVLSLADNFYPKPVDCYIELKGVKN